MGGVLYLPTVLVEFDLLETGRNGVSFLEIFDYAVSAPVGVLASSFELRRERDEAFRDLRREPSLCMGAAACGA
ncbi:hypothetical protein ASC70_01995 [Caulobacter sp. Root343]|nr:hypothetical protein ASC62_11045 [Caulobacter sp. Root342]KQV72471.1 hypothetical protein ASC70_01995 [Caulobacter sp. Root343]